MRRILLALAILALAVPALAHDVHVVEAVEGLEAKITDLRARQDQLLSHLQNQGGAINELFRLVDNLRARADIGESSAGSLNSAIDELYRLVDALSGNPPPDGDEEAP